ncbi:uncharacterized protein LOC129909229 isoform X1 [Episyrphus balteatus]|uniref:uncharacterized protein LOC129909229 isoform X1 n=1 Tax=Episyrphus balteatus TaxID=286459 RepID=UPI002486A2BB|nr:uncharacterized protein LOC129909229 isoform X1 [Episyrphus balteatus]
MSSLFCNACNMENDPDSIKCEQCKSILSIENTNCILKTELENDFLDIDEAEMKEKIIKLENLNEIDKIELGIETNNVKLEQAIKEEPEFHIEPDIELEEEENDTADYKKEDVYECTECNKWEAMSTSSAESNSGAHTCRPERINSTESSKTSSSHPDTPRNRPEKYHRINSDTKNILIKCYNDGKSINESAVIAGIKQNTAKYIIRQYNKNGGLIEKKRGGIRSFKLTSTILNKIEQIIEENPSITLNQICQQILVSEHKQLCISSIRNGIKQLRITIKCPCVEVRNCERTIMERKMYAIEFSRNALEDRQKIVFIDECAFECHLPQMARGRHVSLVAAINTTGIVWHKVQQSAVHSYVSLEFCKALLQKMEDDNLDKVLLILNKASIQSTQEFRNLVGQKNHTLLFLPLNSPMMNPMVEVFSKIKLIARNTLGDSTNHDSLVDVINNAVGNITSSNCHNYYKNMYDKLPAAAAGESL